MLLTLVRRLACVFALCFMAGPAFAAVEISFYARELGGNNFPHAFFVLRGTVDATGEQVDTSLGFTAHSVTPAILFGSVRGEVQVEGERQIARSDRKFTIRLTDAQYRAVMAVVEEWRNAPQPSYNLRRHSCVHFVSAVAVAVGLQVDNSQRLMNRPRSFLERVIELNPHLAATTSTPAAPAPVPADPPIAAPPIAAPPVAAPPEQPEQPAQTAPTP